MAAENPVSHSGLGGGIPPVQGLGNPISLLTTRGVDGIHAPIGVSTNPAGEALVHRRLEAYGERIDRNHGRGFSTQAMVETRLMSAVHDVLGSVSGRRPRIVDIGAGPGLHSLEFAKRGADVITNEPHAVRYSLHETVANSGLNIDVVTEDAHSFLANLSVPVDVVYANSVLHFWDEQTRGEFYKHAHRALGDPNESDKFLAISFKAQGDVQQEISTFDRRGLAGSYGIDSVDTGITRLFVDNQQAIIEELHAAGFEVVGVYNWDFHARYDFPDEPEDSLRRSKFVGFLARKVGQTDMPDRRKLDVPPVIREDAGRLVFDANSIVTRGGSDFGTGYDIVSTK